MSLKKICGNTKQLPLHCIAVSDDATDELLNLLEWNRFVEQKWDYN